MSNAWEMVSLDPWDSVVLRMPLYLLTISNVRCWAKDTEGVVVMLNKANGRLRLGTRASCGP